MKKTDPYSPDNIDKTKTILSGFGSALGIGLGIATSNPALVAGGGFSFFSTLLGSKVSGRINEHLNELHRNVLKLEKTMEEFKPENLVKNEKFISAILQTTQIASRTHDEEKLEYLRNATLNVVLPIDVKENLQFNFIRYIDELNFTHIQILKFFYDNSNEIETLIRKNIRRAKDVILPFVESKFKDLEGKSERYLIDLENNGLLDKLHDGGGMSSTITEKNTNFQISNEGEQFLRFIQLSKVS